MVHFGFVSPAAAGHFNPMSALARELQRRGHRISFVGLADARVKALALGYTFVQVGRVEFPEGSEIESLKTATKLRGVGLLGYLVRYTERAAFVFCRDAPEGLKNSGVEALVIDQIDTAAPTVADYLGIPYVTVCNALPINYEEGIPPFFTDWPYVEGELARLVNNAGYLLLSSFVRPIGNTIGNYRRRFGLPSYREPNESFSKLAQISQYIQELDFPREKLPRWFHYVGPLRDLECSPVSFPYEKLTNSSVPVIYASLGTILNERREVFAVISEALRNTEFQVVLSHGGALTKAQIDSLPSNFLAVPYAPQPEIFEWVDLTVTHAGLNTVLDSLSKGVPMVCLPQTAEQPGTAARVEWARVGVSLKNATPSLIRDAVQKVLSDPFYKANANRMRQVIARSGGVVKAADIVEQVMKSKVPVLSLH